MAADVFNNLKMIKPLIDDPQNCLEVITQTMQFQLPSYFSEDVHRGIREMLNMELKRYSSRWKGNAMAYENVRLKQTGACFMDDLPFMSIEAVVDFIVFKPSVGCTLRGIVNKISKDHIGCLILGCFNASLLRPQDDAWNCPAVTQGSSVLLEVTSLNVAGKVTFIRGNLLQVEDGQGTLSESFNSPVLDDDGYVSELQPSLPSVSSVDDIFQKPVANFKQPLKKYFGTDESDTDSLKESPKRKPKKNRSAKNSSSDEIAIDKFSGEQHLQTKQKTENLHQSESESDNSAQLFITQTPSRAGWNTSGGCSHLANEPDESDDESQNENKFTKKKNKKMEDTESRVSCSQQRHSKSKRKILKDSSGESLTMVAESKIKSLQTLQVPREAFHEDVDSSGDIVMADSNKKNKKKFKDKSQVQQDKSNCIESTVDATNYEYSEDGQLDPKTKTPLKMMVTSSKNNSSDSAINAVTDSISTDVKRYLKVKDKRKSKSDDLLKSHKRVKVNESSESDVKNLDHYLFGDTMMHTIQKTMKKHKGSLAIDDSNGIVLTTSKTPRKVGKKHLDKSPMAVKVESKDFYSDDEALLGLGNLDKDWKVLVSASKPSSSSRKGSTKLKKAKKNKKKKKKQQPKKKKLKRESGSKDRKKKRKREADSYRVSPPLKKHKIKKELE